MPSPPQSTAPTRPPMLVICLVILAVFAVLGVIATILLTALDANGAPDLPDPLVNNVGDFAVCTSIITMILLGIHLLRTTSAANTRAGVAAIAAARHDILDDTGEIHGIQDAVRNPHYIVVRDPGPFDKLDRDRTKRTLSPAEYRAVYKDALADLADMQTDLPDEPSRA